MSHDNHAMLCQSISIELARSQTQQLRFSIKPPNGISAFLKPNLRTFLTFLTTELGTRRVYTTYEQLETRTADQFLSTLAGLVGPKCLHSLLFRYGGKIPWKSLLNLWSGPSNVMFIVGLTGGIATGKSTVSRIFKDLGCPVVDADQIAREVVKPHQPAWNALVQSFGRDILLPNEEINREKLGKIVFGDDAKRRVLNKCTHPSIYRSIWWNLMKCFISGERFVILDLPLLYESGAALFLMKEVIVVYCDQATQLKRLMDRNNFAKSDAEQRINAQMSLDEKCKRASYVINNSSNRESTEKQVERLYGKFSRSYAYLPLRIFVLLVVVFIAWLLFYLIKLVS